MKGKYAKRAEIRRDWNALEKRAIGAEEYGRRLETELDRLRDRTDREIASLRAALTGAIGQRDAAASPKLTQAERRISELTEELSKLRDEDARRQKSHDRVFDNFSTFLVKKWGLSPTEAFELTANLAGLKERGAIRVADVYAGVDPKNFRDNPDGAMRVQRARGHRHANDPVSEVLDVIRDGGDGAVE